MTFDQLDYETLMTDPMTWHVNLQAEALAESSRRIHAIGTMVLGCFHAVPEMKAALASDYRRLKLYLKTGHICAEGYRTSLASIHEVLADNGLLGSGWSSFDDLAYEIQIAIVFSQMLEAIFGADWTLDQFTPDNITAFLDGLDHSPTATKHRSFKRPSAPNRLCAGFGPRMVSCGPLATATYRRRRVSDNDNSPTRQRRGSTQCVAKSGAVWEVSKR